MMVSVNMGKSDFELFDATLPSEPTTKFDFGDLFEDVPELNLSCEYSLVVCVVALDSDQNV